MKPYDKIPYTNSVGQVIKPGDKVVLLTQGRGNSIRQRVGIFMGTRSMKHPYSNQQLISTLTQIDETKRVWWDKKTGEVLQRWKQGADMKSVPHTRISTVTSNRIFKI